MNYLISFCFLCIGVYFVYNTYKKPSPMVSTDLKGYFGGFTFIYIAIMGFIGKMDVFQIIKDIFNIK